MASGTIVYDVTEPAPVSLSGTIVYDVTEPAIISRTGTIVYDVTAPVQRRVFYNGAWRNATTRVV